MLEFSCCCSPTMFRADSKALRREIVSVHAALGAFVKGRSVNQRSTLQSTLPTVFRLRKANTYDSSNHKPSGAGAPLSI